MITALHIIGQILFGGFFIYNGIKHITSHKDYTAYASSMKVPMPQVAVFVTGVLIILGGLGVVFQYQLNIALILLAIFLIPVTFTMHAFWKLESPADRSSQKIQFLKNIGLLGAVLLMFA